MICHLGWTVAAVDDLTWPLYQAILAQWHDTPPAALILKWVHMPEAKRGSLEELAAMMGAGPQPVPF